MGRQEGGRRSAARGLVRFAKSHRASFAGGLVAALVVVGARLALPWTLRAALEPILSADSASRGASGALRLLEWPLLLWAVLFLGLLTIMGYADHRERLSFARFSIGVVHDIRSKAARAISCVSVQPSGPGVRRGDIIARLIGDTARIKAGLKGFLVHVATNGIMALGVSIVLIVIDPALGLVFSLGVLLTMLVTWRAARGVYRRAAKYRAREGALADTLHATHSESAGSDLFTTGSSESAGHEAGITLLQGRATWASHSIFGAAVLACLLVGVAGARSGRIDAGHLVVFAFYALMMRAPLVQLTRQGVRTGKIIACLERVLEIADLESARSDTRQPPVLSSRLWLRDVRVRLGKGAAKRSALRIDSIEIPAGQRVALIGPQGSGKTMLLQLLAGSQRFARGRIGWDEEVWDLSEGVCDLTGRSQFVPALPTWPRQPLRSTLGAGPGVPDEQAVAVLRACGAGRIIRRLPDGLDSKVSSDDLSLGERKQVALARALLWTPAPPLLLVDDVTAGLTKRGAKKAVSAALSHAGSRTIVMSFSRPIQIKRFDRIIELRNGRITSDAGPAALIQPRGQSGLDPCVSSCECEPAAAGERAQESA